MIGIVIVSHSTKLAQGVLELVEQMTKGKVPLAISGGIDDPQNPIGTDALDVHRAIESVCSADGVLVLMDLGSALLSAEMALEFLPDEQRSRVRLCEAPLVEGAVAAAVQAMASNDIDAVMAEARGALAAKASQLNIEVPAGAAPETAAPTSAIAPIQLTIPNQLGLHARPAAQFVSTAGRFQATIQVENITEGLGPANAKSINQVATLGARQGHRIAVSAEGPDAHEALEALKSLVMAGFGETDAAFERAPAAQPSEAPFAQAGALAGVPAAPGIAIGPLSLYRLAPVIVPERATEDPPLEWAHLQKALQAARQNIQALRAQATARAGDYEAAIFDAHLLYLDDPALLDAVRHRIFQQQEKAEAAWQAGIDEMVAAYKALKDPYQQARAADVGDVGQQVLQLLVEAGPAAVELAQPAILVASELTPSDTAQLDLKKVLGICTEAGSATSHTAILLRAMGLPAVMGLGTGLTQLAEGTTLAMDGAKGGVWVDPAPDILAGLKKQREVWVRSQLAARAAGRQPAKTQDGRRVHVMANIGGAIQVQNALDHGAEGVGLLRTEFLFLDRTSPPSEEEQVAAYTRIADELGSRPFVIRTLDVGGDKPISYLDLAQEPNPFLGWRGIRICLDHPELFKTQLRAILRASAGRPIRVMFPMVSSRSEVRAVKKLLSEAQDELSRAGLRFNSKMEVGIMVEVPAVVALADQLAAEVDFFSIGTNDLSQYIMAADRTNPNVRSLSDAFQPAVLRSIQQIITAAHAASIWVGLCGELAGDPLAVPLLLGLGLDEFSMNPPAIPAVKQAIAKLSMAQAEAIAAVALRLESADEVRAYLARKHT